MVKLFLMLTFPYFNLPNYSSSDLIKVVEMLKRIVPTHPPFPARGEGLLVIPTSVSIPIYTPRTLGELPPSLDKELQEIGVPDNKSYAGGGITFSNITIVRFTRTPNRAFYECLEQLRNIRLPPFQIKEARLVSSNLAFSEGYYEEFGTFSLRESMR